MNVADASGDFAMLPSPIGPRAELETDRLHQCIEAVEADKQKLELDRLLYVACTRARRSLHLIGSVALKASGNEINKPPAGSLLERLWPAVQQRFTTAFAEGRGIQSGKPAQQVRFRAPTLRRFPVPFELPPPPPLRSASELPDRAGSEPDLDFYWVGRTARHAGTIVHALLKKIAEGRITADAESVSALRRTTARMAAEMGVADDALAEVSERVDQSLRGVLEDSRGRWVVSGDGYVELPLTGQWQGRTVSIVIDRVRIDEGIHWIIDYKTSSHEGGDLERFLDEEEQRYRPQLQRYVELYSRAVRAEVRAALYFPLLKKFREVKIERAMRD
jgi:ATP-dependent exoDNAse (exonuclease V) beta subunit